ncbi:hypothetical protein Q3G72_033834 [Acer saccharum]|nr:hypothetical protein Q3G72_033834 [Acer saccharum]
MKIGFGISDLDNKELVGWSFLLSHKHSDTSKSSSSYYGELWKAWIGPSERRRRRKLQQRKEMKAKPVWRKETEMKMKPVRRKETKTKAAAAEGEGKVEERERRKVEVLEEI